MWSIMKKRVLLALTLAPDLIANIPLALSNRAEQRIPLYYWKESFINFGDHLSLKLIERIVQSTVEVYQKQTYGINFFDIHSRIPLC